MNLNFYEVWSDQVSERRVLDMGRLVAEVGFYRAVIMTMAMGKDPNDGWSNQEGASAALARLAAAEGARPWSERIAHGPLRELRQGLETVFGPAAQLRTKNALEARTVTEHEAMTHTLRHLHLALFQQHGQHSFVAAPGLAEALLDTELRGLKGEDVRLPHPSIWVDIPMELGFRMWSHLDGWRPVVGAFLAEDRLDAQDPRLFLFFIGNADGQVDQAPCMPHNTMLTSSVPLRDGVALDELLQDPISRLTKRMPEDKIEAIKSEWLKTFRWILNLLIYATWPDAEREHLIANPEARKLLERLERAPKGHPRRRKILDELKVTPRQDRDVFGRHVIVHDRQMAPDGDPGLGRPLTKRVRVSGFWRHQACGPKMSERKLIWVEPFWRGPMPGEDDAPDTAPTLHIMRPHA